jgi:hypothetical protein
VDDSAVAGEDYLPATGTLTFPVGETVQTVPVSLVGELLNEAHEIFFLDVQLVGGEGIVALNTRGVGTIVNDDACPVSTNYWEAHPDEWPVHHLLIGDVEYGAAALGKLLDYTGGDAATRLARELVGTRFNLAVGSDPAVLPLVQQVDAFLEQYPPGSKPQGEAKQTARDLRIELEQYNTDPC